MRHLKSRKIFESSETIIETIKDICFELGDIGFDISIGNPPHYFSPQLVINKKSRQVGFSFNEVKEVVERLQDYLGKGIIRIDFINSIAFKSISGEIEWLSCQHFSPERRHDPIFAVRIIFDNIESKIVENLSDDLFNQTDYLRDIKDICLELEDEGYYTNTNNEYLFIGSKKNEECVVFKDVSEVIMRLFEYLSLIGLNPELMVNTPPKATKLKKTEFNMIEFKLLYNSPMGLDINLRFIRIQYNKTYFDK